MDQPGKAADPARGQLNNRENNIPLSSCMPENLVSLDGFSRPVPRQPTNLHTQGGRYAFGSSVKYFSRFLRIFLWMEARLIQLPSYVLQSSRVQLAAFSDSKNFTKYTFS